MNKYVIIGTGVAGIGAAQAIRDVDKTGTITFITEDPHGYYSRPGLAYYLTGEVDEDLLFPFQTGDFKKLDAHFWRGSVIRIHPSEHQVELHDGRRIPYDRLLLAVGSRAVGLNVPGANLAGVVKLDDLEDARGILSLAKRGQTAVVVGGGITALELAEGLAARKMKVHLLVRKGHYWSTVLDEVESRIVEARLRAHKISIHHNSELTEVLGKNGRVVGISLANGQKAACDLVAYGIGIQPRLTLAKETSITCERGVLVDEHLRTNLTDIFAAGDVAQVFDPFTGRSVIESLWSPAREQGRVAGLNMAGQDIAYLTPIPLNVTRLAGLTTTIIGAVGSGRDDGDLTIAHGDSETWRDMPDAIITQSGFDVNHLRLMVGAKTIVGAIVMGDQKLSSALQTIIREHVDISPIRQELIAPNAPIADIVARLWTQMHAGRV